MRKLATFASWSVDSTTILKTSFYHSGIVYAAEVKDSAEITAKIHESYDNSNDVLCCCRMQGHTAILAINHKRYLLQKATIISSPVLKGACKIFQ